MTTKKIDVPVGTRVGRLVVESETYKKNNVYYVDCVCDCGNKRSFQKRILTKPDVTKRVQSCGCLQREKASTLKSEIPVGSLFGMLTITEDLGMSGKRRMLKAICSCGNETTTRWDQVKSGHTKSCGCLQPLTTSERTTTHGLSNTATYDSWVAMKQRCTNEKSNRYGDYGARGISYDPRWESFENFYADMGERPDGTTLDRIDVNRNYNKENCRWVKDSVQVHNQRKRKSNGEHEVTSVFKGVSFCKEKKKWSCRLQREGIILFRKRFETELEAAIEYDNISFEHYGDRPNEELIKNYIERNK